MAELQKGDWVRRTAQPTHVSLPILGGFMVRTSPITPALQKENGLFLVDIEATPLPAEFVAKEKLIVYLPPREIGGNHVHARTEVLIGIGEGLIMSWIDSNGKTHTEPMNPNGQLRVMIVESMTPHAVVNRSDSFGILIEYANGDLSDAQPVTVIAEP